MLFSIESNLSVLFFNLSVLTDAYGNNSTVSRRIRSSFGGGGGAL